MGATEKGRCPKCGHEEFETGASPKANDYLTCARCRHRFKVERAFTHVVERAQRDLNRAVDKVNRQLAKLFK